MGFMIGQTLSPGIGLELMRRGRTSGGYIRRGGGRRNRKGGDGLGRRLAWEANKREDRKLDMAEDAQAKGEKFAQTKFDRDESRYQDAKEAAGVSAAAKARGADWDRYKDMIGFRLQGSKNAQDVLDSMSEMLQWINTPDKNTREKPLGEDPDAMRNIEGWFQQAMGMLNQLGGSPRDVAALQAMAQNPTSIPAPRAGGGNAAVEAIRQTPFGPAPVPPTAPAAPATPAQAGMPQPQGDDLASVVQNFNGYYQGPYSGQAFTR
jgi:hypothetical protein